MIEESKKETLCACGCGFFTQNRPYIYGHKKKFFDERGDYLCECGCGGIVAPGKRFILGHAGRGTKRNEEILQKMRHPKLEQGRLNIKAGANKPEVRENRSRLAKIQGADPVIKAKLLETNAKPEVRARKSAIQKEVQNRPEVKEKVLNGLKIANAKPETHARRSNAAKECQNRPEVKAKQVEVQKEAQNRPEVKAKISVSSKITNAKPEVHERRVKSAIESSAKPEVKAKKSAAQKEIWSRPDVRESRSGENSNKWQGGKSFEEYGVEFDKDLKRDIRERDGFHCRNCFDEESRLDVHHIDYEKKNASHDNLITLCISCHMKTNYNREKWTVFYKAKMVPLSELDRFNS